MSDCYETRWMFALLNYEHWRVFYVGQEVGLLVVNTVDRSVSFSVTDERKTGWFEDIPTAFMAAYRWARQHEVPE